MAAKTNKTPVFSFSALQQAMDKLYAAAVSDEGQEGPQNPARRMLMKQAGAAAITNALPATSLLSAAAKLSQNADLEAALESYIIQFNGIWVGVYGEKLRNTALINKIYYSTSVYSGLSDKEEYEFEKNPKEAILWYQKRSKM